MLHFHEIYMPQFGENRVVTVYLPPSYGLGKRYYSVIYMQDGQNLFDDGEAFGGVSWHIDETIDRMPIYKQAIVVGIHNGEVDRIDEYTPFKRNKQGGKGADYLRFIVETLKPFIDNNYRTLTPPQHTWLVGSSLGGLISLYGGLIHPSVFGKIGVMSPSIWFNPSILQVKSNGNVSNSRFYFVGSKAESSSMEADLQKCYWRMKELGVAEEKLMVLITDKGKHSELYWRQTFRKMYLELIK